MVRAARSQRQASQSQPRANAAASSSQPRRSQRSQRAEEDDSDADMDYGDDDRMEGGGGGDEDDLARKANDLVRLALFHEQKRSPLRREEISKKALGGKSRSFGLVFLKAQETLRNTFGMEMVELLARVEAEDTNVQKEKEAMNLKKKSSAVGTKTFILRSTLAPALIQVALTRDEDLLEVEQTEKFIATEEEAEPENAFGTRSTGSILAWHANDQLASVGILYVILALILVNGRSLSDADLRASLKRLRLNPTTLIPQSNQSTHHALTVDAYLSSLNRQGFLECRRVGDKSGAKKRGRGPAPTQGDDNSITTEWRWGPRAVAEVGEQGIAKFVAEFMVQPTTEEDDDDAVAAGQEDRTHRKVEKMVQGVEKAAGGKLLNTDGKAPQE